MRIFQWIQLKITGNMIDILHVLITVDIEELQFKETIYAN